jgi:transposase
MGGSHRLPLALHVPRPACVGGGLPPDAAVAQSRRLRGDGPRLARTLAPFGEPGTRADGRHTRLAHPAFYPGERLSGGYDGAKRKKGSKVHAAVDTSGNLLALHVSPANEQDRGRVEELAGAVQQATGESVELAYVDQGYTGEKAAEEAEAHGMRLEVVRHQAAKRGFVLLPRRWVVERDFASGIALSTLGEGLREAIRHFGGVALRRLSLPLSPAGDRHFHHGFITRSSERWGRRLP